MSGAGAGRSAGTATEIAVVGLAGRFPGAGSVAELWRNLRTGVESISFATAADLAASCLDPALLGSPGYVNAAGVLDGIELFDAAFFGFGAREADVLDPQQRLFLECAWEALEDAGHDAQRFAGRIGLFAGAGASGYRAQVHAHPELVAWLGSLQIGIANEKDHLTTQTAYKLDLRGPCVTVQTACSTSLVAVVLACQSLLGGHCDLALAGGVSIGLPQRAGYFYREGGILSPDGHCRAFDAAAAGTVGGNGAGIVVLARLADALAAGHTIHAVIHGAAVNNDGAGKVGYTAPSIGGQAEVISLAQAMAGFAPETITYVEAHGTGTSLGDPIEVAALTDAFRAGTSRVGYCGLGSVKTNLGHLDTAAGIAGLIKTVLALRHRELPPSLHFAGANPRLELAGSPFFVVDRLRPWDAAGGPLRAGVSSFGIGGTNAHVVLEEAPPVAAGGPARRLQLLQLSARTAAALERATANLAAHLRGEQPHLADVAFTLAAGRRSFPWRRTVIGGSRDEALAALEGRAPARVATGMAGRGGRQLAFLFPGQGSHHAAMGRELYDGEPEFRQAIDLCAEILRPRLGLDLRSVLYPPRGAGRGAGTPGEEGANAALAETALAQPALFAVEYALVRLWEAWGAVPEAMLGHSLGELTAACVAGVFSLEDALALVAARGALMQRLPAGAMLSVALAEAEVEPLLGDEIALAAVNGPALSVLSGPSEAVGELAARLASAGVACRRLHVSRAFHSPVMDAVVPELAARVAAVRRSPPAVPFVSNVTGTWIEDEEATDPAYWGAQLRRTVRFAGGLRELLAEPSQVLLEVGPGNALSTLARQQRAAPAGGDGRPDPDGPAAPASDVRAAVLCSLPHAREKRGALESMLTAAGGLWRAGVPLDGSRLYAHQRRRRVPLPTYPFERERHWVDRPRAVAAAVADGPRASPQPPRAAETSISASASTGGPRSGDAPIERRPPSEWLYAPSWRRATLPPPAVTAAPAGAWLLLADRRGLGEALARRLRGRGERVVVAAAGSRFARSAAEDAFEIAPGSREDYGALLRALAAAGAAPAHVLHLWSVDDPAGATAAERFDAAQERGFYSLLLLAQAVSAARWAAGLATGSRSLDLTVVSTGIQEVTGEEVLHPEKATAMGPCRVIPQELPHIVCRCIDLALPPAAAAAAVPDQVGAPVDIAGADSSELGGNAKVAGPAEAAEIAEAAEQLLAELAAADAAPVVTWRGGHRWLPLRERLSLPPSPSEPTPPPSGSTATPAGPAVQRGLRRGAVVLITGGLGGIGLVLAEHFARRAAARLVLAGRRAFPPPDEWGGWIARHGEHDRVSRAIRVLRRCEEVGAEIMVVRADVADASDIEQLLAAVRARFGELHGVVHAAAETGRGAFQTVTAADRATCERQLRAKASGLLALDAALADVPLDFRLCFSSLAALLGGLRFAAYSAANLFLDAFATAERRGHRRRAGAPWRSIGWDGWRLDAAGATAAAEAGGKSELAIAPEQGAELCERLLGPAAPDCAHLMVSTGDLDARFDRWVRLRSLRAAQPEVERAPVSAAALDAAAGSPGATAPQPAPAGDPPAVAPVGAPSGPPVAASPKASGASRSGVAWHARPALSSAFTAPRDSTEEAIGGIWQKLLGVAPIGVHDSFFELGGHSLLAIQLISRLRDLFQVEMPVDRVFEAPTIAEMAAGIAAAEQAQRQELDRLAEMLSLVESLSETEVKDRLSELGGANAASLARRAAATADAGTATAEAAIATPVTAHRTGADEPASPPATAKRRARSFYDAINARLDAAEAGRHARFLNYGYAPDGDAGEAVFTPPARSLNAHCVRLVLETVGSCDLRGARVLDVGCGRGGTLDVLARYFATVCLTGIDLSLAAVAFSAAMGGGSGQRFAASDAERLPFAAASFDVVTNVESSHCYPDRTAFYREVWRVLRPGGRFLYADLLSRDAAAAAAAELAGLGFAVDANRDVTANVLLSCDQTAAVHLATFGAEGPAEELRGFLGLPGSPVYESMRAGELRYRIFRLTRPVAMRRAGAPGGRGRRAPRAGARSGAAKERSSTPAGS